MLIQGAGAASAATLDRLRDTEVIRLGYLAAARPFSYQDEAGRPAGYAVTLCEAIASDLQQSIPSLRSEYIAVEPDKRFDAVSTGAIDLLCAGGTPTLSRREQVSFSIPIFPGGIGVLLRKDVAAQIQSKLAGEPEPFNPRWRASLGQVMQKRNFAVVANSRASAWLEKGIQEFGATATIESVESFDEGLSLVTERRADAVFAEREVLLDALRRSPAQQELKVIERKFTFEPIAFTLQRNDEDFRLLVDAILSRLYRSNGISEMYVPVFGEPDEETRNFFINTAVAE
jgi:ABC-type amino acid transport substrate-binding protein